jgi:hypothetical protein
MNLKLLLRQNIIKFSLNSLLVGILAIAIHLVYLPSVSAQSTTEFRAEINLLRSQIRRLEAEVRRLNQSGLRSQKPSQVPSPPTSTSPPIVNGQPIGTTDPMFQRLATLVIELKEDVKALETRVAEIEQKLNN